jgi:hypothetical protein
VFWYHSLSQKKIIIIIITQKEEEEEEDIKQVDYHFLSPCFSVKKNCLEVLGS